MDPSDITTRRRRKDARPQELLDAALELFVEKGFAATKAEEVATRAGVSKGTLYLYYPSKEDLLKAAIAQNLSDRIAAGAAEAAAFPGTPGQLLRHILVRWWTHVYDSPASAVFKLVITEVRNFPDIAQHYVDEVVEPAEALLGGIIQRGIDSGEFRPVDIGVAVHSLVLPMIMVCLHKHSLGACAAAHHIDGRDFIRQHVELVLNGLARSPVPDGPVLTTNDSGTGAAVAAGTAK